MDYRLTLVELGPYGADWINISEWTSGDPNVEGQIIYVSLFAPLPVQS